jgi:hypothetical protein
MTLHFGFQIFNYSIIIIYNTNQSQFFNGEDYNVIDKVTVEVTVDDLSITEFT